MNEIYNEIKNFLNKNDKGVVQLIYPELFHIKGIEINKQNIDNENRIKFLNDGIMIYHTLGHSVVTGKHLFLPYGNCTFVFNEENDVMW